MSGTSIDAQKRYAAGTKAILESYFSGKHDYKPEDLIVTGGLVLLLLRVLLALTNIIQVTTPQRPTDSAATSPARRRPTTVQSRGGMSEWEISEVATSCII